jgi:hypothetical protein
MCLSYGNITPICKYIANPTRGATCKRWGGMGGCKWAKCLCFVTTKLKNPGEAVKIHNLPQNLPIGSFGNALHNYGANARLCGQLLLICSGFFHIG